MIGQINEVLPKKEPAAKPEIGKTVYLIGNDLSNWRRPIGIWQVVGQANAVAGKQRTLTIKEGTGVLINSTIVANHLARVSLNFFSASCNLPVVFSQPSTAPFNCVENCSI